MSDSIISSIIVLVLGVLLYISLWWNAVYTGWRFARWYFGIVLALAVIVGVCYELFHMTWLSV